MTSKGTKFSSTSDPSVEELAEKIHENRSLIDNARNFWRTYALAFFCFVALIASFVSWNGIRLWGENIEVNKLYEADTARLLKMVGEQRLRVKQLTDQTIALEVDNEKLRQFGLRERKEYRQQLTDLRSDHMDLVHAARQFLKTWHKFTGTTIEPNQVVDWWTSENLQNHLGETRFFAGLKVVGLLAETAQERQEWLELDAREQSKDHHVVD